MAKFFKSNFAFVCYMLLLAVFVVAFILLGVRSWTKHYTRHGDEVVVPQISGMYIDEADIFLREQGLSLQVIDSTYNRKLPLGTIVDQKPPQGATTKRGRQVYVVTNARMQRLTPIPDLHDQSYRQAVATLQSLGMEVSDVIYKPSEFGGLVLDVLYKNATLSKDARLPEGSQLVLVVGQSANGAETAYVPSLIGLTLEQARKLLLDNSLVMGGVNYDEESIDPNDNAYLVYYHEPEQGTWVSEGSRITLYLSKDPNKKMEKTTNDPEEDEEFF